MKDLFAKGDRVIFREGVRHRAGVIIRVWEGGPIIWYEVKREKVAPWENEVDTYSVLSQEDLILI